MLLSDYLLFAPGGWTSDNVVGIRARKEATDEISAIHYGPGRVSMHPPSFPSADHTDLPKSAT